jgi:hypothetical protein
MIWSWSSMYQPSVAEITSDLWRNTAGTKRYWMEGNSNVAYMPVTLAVSNDAWNIADGGDIPQGCINQFNNVLKPQIDAQTLAPPEKVYIQIGANFYRNMPCGQFYWNTYEDLKAQMGTLIDLYKGVVANPTDIVVAGMPYVRSDMRVTEIPGYFTTEFGFMEYLTRLYWRAYLEAFPWNNFLYNGSAAIASVCQQKGVQFLDIWNPLYATWLNYYSEPVPGVSAHQSHWWDQVHYDSQIHISLIGPMIKTAWGI